MTKYLLFGTLDKQKEYVVKEGDTLEKIAESNELSLFNMFMYIGSFSSPLIVIVYPFIVKVLFSATSLYISSAVFNLFVYVVYSDRIYASEISGS